MAVWQNTFEGGSNGVAITAGNSGGASGDAFAAVTSNVTFSNAQAHQGTYSMEVGGGATGNYGRMAVSAHDLAVEHYVRFSTAHTGDYFMVQFRMGAGTPQILTLLVNGANQLRLRNNTTSENLWTAGNSLPLNQFVRVVVLVRQGTTDSSGEIRVGYFLGDSTTPIELSPWFTSQDLQGDAGVITQVLFGKISTSAYSGTAYFDSMRVLSGADYVDLLETNTAPVADAGPNQFVLAGETVQLDGSGTDADQDDLTYQWVFLWPATGAPTLSGATTLTPSFTAGPTGAVYALQLTVDDGEDTDSDTMNVAVVPELGSSSVELVWDGTAWV